MSVENSNFVILLGTKGGPAIRTGSTNPTSNLLVLNNRQIVVDCGLGVTRSLVDQGMQLKDLNLIFITHLHSDHYLEMGSLIHTAWVAGLNTAVKIYGPKGLENYWNNFLKAMEFDIAIRLEDEGRPDLRSLVTIHEIDEGEIFNEEGIKVEAMRNEHPPLVETFALKFQTEKNKIIFSGDTAYLPRLAEFAAGADLLIHEAMLEEALISLFKRIGNTDDRLMEHWLRSHTMAPDAGKIATKAGVKTLALNHLIPSDDPNFIDDDWHKAVKPTWQGKLIIGKDGLKIDFT